MTRWAMCTASLKSLSKDFFLGPEVEPDLFHFEALCGDEEDCSPLGTCDTLISEDVALALIAAHAIGTPHTELVKLYYTLTGESPETADG